MWGRAEVDLGSRGWIWGRLGANSRSIRGRVGFDPRGEPVYEEEEKENEEER